MNRNLEKDERLNYSLGASEKKNCVSKTPKKEKYSCSPANFSTSKLKNMQSPNMESIKSNKYAQNNSY